MGKAKATIRSAGGIGESKIFCAPFPEPTGVDKILTCHINGVAVSDMKLDPQVLSLLDYGGTDEGIAEKNSRENVRPASGITAGADEFAKALQQRRDDVLDRGRVLFESRDPLKEIADQYVGPGMRPKFLSAQNVRQNAGAGIHEIVKQANGDPVMVKGMVLGQVPIEVADARNKHYRDRGNNMLAQIDDQFSRAIENTGAKAIIDPQ